MNNSTLETAIKTRGRQFFDSIRGEAPSVFNKGFWTGKVMDWAMQNEDFKVQLFRFVDVLPYLNTSESLSRHIEEYFSGNDSGDIPAVLKWGAEKSGLLGSLATKVMGKAIRSNLEGMARSFIIGQNTKEAIKSLAKIRKQGFAFTVDLLGEATVGENEADAFRDSYLELLDALVAEQKKWPPLDSSGNLDWNTAPKLNVSVKPSALFSQAKPVDVEGSVEGILARLRPIYAKIIAMGGAMCIDMEALKYKEITIELFKRLRLDPEFRDYPYLSIVLQAYLRDTENDLNDLITWARDHDVTFGLRLVKGAYWDFETVQALQNGWPIPVWTRKPESDIAYERLARIIFENNDLIYFQCASHNVRTISTVMEIANELHVSDSRYEFQVLFGMAEPVRKGLLNVAGRVRLYCPYGDLLPGMAYLVRRLLENTANESFLRLSFADNTETDRLLENPQITLDRELAAEKQTSPARAGVTPFKNHNLIDFTIPEVRSAFTQAIAERRVSMGGTVPLFIDGKDVTTHDTLTSTNPAHLAECIGNVCQAGTAEIDRALEAAQRAFPAWRDLSAEDRANYIFKTADLARKRIYNLSATQILEVGKQWDQAYHDVGEAIDFLEYYGREMIRLGQPVRLGNAPGENNQLFYEAKGPAAIIAPWNFPLAIACGMASAAIVTGNPVLFKPAGTASVVGRDLADLFRDAGLPPGVFNFVPGRGSVIGDYLVEHPDIHIIAFTGSVEVGTRILERANIPKPDQTHVKSVITEMGGKNAIILDDDADLDEAVLHILYSAFAYQGQKCSACSRVIAVESIHDRFLERLVDATTSMKIGPAEDPAYAMGPVADAKQQELIKKYIEIARQEGRIIVERTVPENGCYVPLTVVADIKPEHRIAQEEIFGPVLAIMKARDFDDALAIANGTRFALTGGIFSRSPKHIEKAKREFHVGNLYINRNNTGAMVERQAFGGFKMSGTGPKTGGPNYLHAFLHERVVTENTVRRGFAPIAEDDEWIE
ncbi:proline dehydrogenase family protein [Desulfovibrio inopinatus]|uniref:proline dehydrogenase family protein n=1 Tax=Desulfovibrio inopinatus TaxID=102109 RepID=UPI00040FBE77|nr:proline dehydrogenase family protein [Desulfovibrio inopinatus]